MFDEARPCPYVPHEDLFVFAATCNEAIGPSAGTNSMQMATHRSNRHLLLDVPNLHLTIVGTDGEMSALLGPRDRGDSVPISQIDKLADRACVSVPDVDMLA